MAAEDKNGASLPPRWFVRLAWYAHRGVYRVTGGRVGLWRPKADRWGTARLTTIGRRSGQERSVMVGYFEDGPNLVTMAMNGWADGEPAWWLNLQAHPEASVEVSGGRRAVRGRSAEGEERVRLWNRWRQIDENLDAYAARRSGETAVVVLEPRAPDVPQAAAMDDESEAP
jgi:deazaflavin-dependent oxidoreductase (nitroreductase family)